VGFKIKNLLWEGYGYCHPLSLRGEVRWKDLAEEYNTRMVAWLELRPRVTH